MNFSHGGYRVQRPSGHAICLIEALHYGHNGADACFQSGLLAVELFLLVPPLQPVQCPLDEIQPVLAPEELTVHDKGWRSEHAKRFGFLAVGFISRLYRLARLSRQERVPIVAVLEGDRTPDLRIGDVAFLESMRFCGAIRQLPVCGLCYCRSPYSGTSARMRHEVSHPRLWSASAGADEPRVGSIASAASWQSAC